MQPLFPPRCLCVRYSGCWTTTRQLKEWVCRVPLCTATICCTARSRNLSPWTPPHSGSSYARCSWGCALDAWARGKDRGTSDCTWWIDEFQCDANQEKTKHLHLCLLPFYFMTFCGPEKKKWQKLDLKGFLSPQMSAHIPLLQLVK